MKIDYLVKITTSQNITARYYTLTENLDIEKFINCVMKSEKCPRRSIVKINIIQVDHALKRK